MTQRPMADYTYNFQMLHFQLIASYTSLSKHYTRSITKGAAQHAAEAS